MDYRTIMQSFLKDIVDRFETEKTADFDLNLSVTLSGFINRIYKCDEIVIIILLQLYHDKLLQKGVGNSSYNNAFDFIEEIINKSNNNNYKKLLGAIDGYKIELSSMTMINLADICSEFDALDSRLFNEYYLLLIDSFDRNFTINLGNNQEVDTDTLINSMLSKLGKLNILDSFISKLEIPFRENQDNSVYDPFGCISRSGFENVSSFSYYSQIKESKFWIYSIIRLMANGLDASHCYNEDSLVKWKYRTDSNKGFDLVISTPPMDTKLQDRDQLVEEYFIFEGLKSLNKNGKLVGLFLAEFLHINKTKDIRRHLVEENILEAVITLSNDQTNGGSEWRDRVPAALLVINKAKALQKDEFRDKVLFIDGSHFDKIDEYKDLLSVFNSDHCRLVPNSEIIDNDYILSPGRYFRDFDYPDIINNDDYRLVKLGEIFSYYPKITHQKKDALYVINDKNLATDVLSYRKVLKDFSHPGNRDEVMYPYGVNDEVMYPYGVNSDNIKVADEAVFFSRDAKNPNVTYFKASDKEILYCSPNVFSFKLNNNFDLDYVVFELTKNYVKQQFKAYQRPIRLYDYDYYEEKINKVEYRIDGDDLLNISIVCPNDIIKQKDLSMVTKLELQQKKVVDLGYELELIKDTKREQYIRDMRLRRHAILQVLNDFSSDFENLSLCKDNNGGKLFDDSIVSKKTGEVVSEYFIKLRSKIHDLEGLIISLTKEIEFEEPQPIQLEQFINDYIGTNGIGHNFKIVFKGYELETPEKKELIHNVSFSKIALKQVFDNIITNARIHGFTDDSRNDYEVIIKLKDEGQGYVLISISNNGNPLPQNMDSDKYFTFGSGSRSGLGGWQVRHSVENYGGSVKLICNDDSKYPVDIRIRLKKNI